MAAPRLVQVGWRRYFLSQLTVGDIADYYALEGNDGDLTMGDVRLLVWLSLRKYQPEISLSSIRWRFLTGKKLSRIFDAIVNFNDAVFKPAADGNETSIREGFEVLLKTFGELYKFDCSQVRNLTLRQVDGYLKKCGSCEAREYSDPAAAQKAIDERKQKYGL